MNTARMDSLLSRQKQHLVTDALYALMVAIGLIIYMLGLGLGTSAKGVHEPQGQVAPAVAPSTVEQAEHCPPGAADAPAAGSWLC